MSTFFEESLDAVTALLDDLSRDNARALSMFGAKASDKHQTLIASDWLKERLARCLGRETRTLIEVTVGAIDYSIRNQVRQHGVQTIGDALPLVLSIVLSTQMAPEDIDAALRARGLADA